MCEVMICKKCVVFFVYYYYLFIYFFYLSGVGCGEGCCFLEKLCKNSKVCYTKKKKMNTVYRVEHLYKMQ